MMFNEVPFLDRFGAAAACGFRAVEFLFPYEHPAETILQQIQKYHLEIVLFNMPPGNWAAGERGIPEPAAGPADPDPAGSGASRDGSGSSSAARRPVNNLPRGAASQPSMSLALGPEIVPHQ